MYFIHVHKEILRMIAIFHFFGIWNYTGRGRIRTWCLRLWYLVAYFLFALILALGSITTDNEDEMIYLAVSALVVFVQVFRLYRFLWRKDEILWVICKMGVHAIKDCKEHSEVNKQINSLMKFVAFFVKMILSAGTTMTVISLPFVSYEKRLPFNCYFPFDWRENEFLYVLAFAFVVYGWLFSIVCLFFNAIIWYLMMSFGIKYRTLGHEFRNIGFEDEAATMVPFDRNQSRFLPNLIRLIKKHKDLEKTTHHFKMIFSNIFFIQIVTSGLAICGFVYVLAFSSMANPFKYGVYIATLLYSFFDIFMITYYGNEIKFASSKLAYSVYESNWIEQSRSCKLCILILKEALAKPQVLVVGKIYVLDLEAFSNILSFAYSQFNILKKLQP